VASQSRQARPNPPQRRHTPGGIAPAVRWECHCQTPPVLLATWETGGRVNVKVRDRYWHFDGFGQVHAVCPRCASEHVLDLDPSSTTPEPDTDPAKP
jgi:hypothetical protein